MSRKNMYDHHDVDDYSFPFDFWYHLCVISVADVLYVCLTRNIFYGDEEAMEVQRHRPHVMTA